MTVTEIATPAWAPPLLLEACGKHRQFSVDRPFVRKTWLWGTNGVILVRHALTEAEWHAIPDEWQRGKRRLPNVLDVWEQFAPSEPPRHFVPLPPGDYEPKPCPQCDGIGAYTAFADCEECEGEGVRESCFRVLICEMPNVVLLSRYVGMLLRHGVTSVATDDSRDPVYFAGPGFEGLLMSCTPDLNP